MTKLVFKEIVDHLILLSQGRFEEFDIQCYYVKNVRPVKINMIERDELDHLYYNVVYKDLYSACSTLAFTPLEI